MWTRSRSRSGSIRAGIRDFFGESAEVGARLESGGPSIAGRVQSSYVPPQPPKDFSVDADVVAATAAPVTGVSGAATRRSAFGEESLIVAQAHGILTGKSSPSWPEFGSAYFAAHHPHVSTVNTEYYELPLPRVAAVRNPARAHNLVRRMKTAAQYRVEMRDTPAELAFVSHSNGAVLALQAVRELIRDGIAVRSLIMIAPAVRTKSTTREVAAWLESGMLGYALLVRPMADTLIGSIGKNWRTKLIAWPWGSLGIDGWAEDDRHRWQQTIDLPSMGHTDPVAPATRLWLYDTIISPALCLRAWGDIRPNGEVAA